MSILIQNGLLVDPANRIYEKKNLLIEGGKIAAVTDEAPAAGQVIDASGRVVCPGFIDVHMHEDPVEDGQIAHCIFHSMLRMGVTTAVGGNCGDNVYDPVEYLNLADRDGAPVNVALFAGHSYFRKRAGGCDRYAGITQAQRKDMLASLQAAIDGGCVGISFGLRYVPGADEDEFRAAARLCAPAGKLISAHVRDDAAYIFDAVKEVTRVGRDCGVPVQISHIGSMGGFGQMEELLAQIDAEREAGLDVACDCYPYAAFSTGIGETTYDEGWLERYHCDYSACVPVEGKYKGVPCTKEIFEELRRDDPDCITVCYVMQAGDVAMALRHPLVMLGSDGFIDKGQGHPRAAGCFPRFLREYVAGGEIDLFDGIAKMTSMPAQRLGFENKGRLNVGADADVVIFDPARIRDRATFDEPALAPEGIDYVFIGGEVAAKDCAVVNDKLGRAVRK